MEKTTEIRTYTAAGYPIIRQKAARQGAGQVPGRIIIADISSRNAYHPFAVWWMRDEDGQTFNGDYCSTERQAVEIWERRS